MGAGDTLERRRQLLGGSLSLAYASPLKIVRGEGAYLYDDKGRPYLDCVNNVCHVGHSHQRVVEAAREQMAALNTNTRYLHDNVVDYASRLVELVPGPLEVCFFVCTGSEANELALRLARSATERKDVVVLDGAYHGHTTALIELSPYKFDGAGGSGRPEHVHVAPTPDPYRGLHRGRGAGVGKAYAELAGELLERAEASALFCESLLGCAGQIVPPPGFLEQAFERARASGAVAVADEVQVGFGRVGTHFWGFEAQGATPDIVTLGKPIGNGHPLAAVITTREIAEAFDNGMEYFNTFGGNPVSCAVGLAVLDVLHEEGLQEHARTVGAELSRRLASLAERHPLVGDVRGMGLFQGIELVRDRKTLEPADSEATRVVEQAKSRGVLLSTDGPLHNVIKIKPPLVFGEAEVELLVTTLDEALSAG